MPLFLLLHGLSLAPGLLVFPVQRSIGSPKAQNLGFVEEMVEENVLLVVAGLQYRAVRLQSHLPELVFWPVQCREEFYLGFFVITVRLWFIFSTYFFELTYRLQRLVDFARVPGNLERLPGVV